MLTLYANLLVFMVHQYKYTSPLFVRLNQINKFPEDMVNSALSNQRRCSEYALHLSTNYHQAYHHLLSLF